MVLAFVDHGLKTVDCIDALRGSDIRCLILDTGFWMSTVIPFGFEQLSFL